MERTAARVVPRHPPPCPFRRAPRRCAVRVPRMTARAPVGVILAGGRATRMGGGDKTLLRLGDTTLLGRVIGRIGPQVTALAINANGDPARFAAYRLPVLPDPLPDPQADRPGPLAGVLAALDWAAGQGADRVLTVPGDTPFLPADLVARLVAASDGAAPVVAATPGAGQATRSMRGDLVRHPACALWPVVLRDDLRAALGRGVRKVAAWADRHDACLAVFDAGGPVDPFFNVNTPDDLRRAEALL